MSFWFPTPGTGPPQFYGVATINPKQGGVLEFSQVTRATHDCTWLPSQPLLPGDMHFNAVSIYITVVLLTFNVVLS